MDFKNMEILQIGFISLGERTSGAIIILELA